jgi:glutathione S-transferase
MTPRLITIGPSHFVEKARWALQRHGIAFHEEPHVPMLHWRATRPHGRRTVPLLVLPGGGHVGESTDILRWVDRTAPRSTPLFPSDPAARAEVEAQVGHWDDKLGVHARRAGYDGLLGSRDAVLEAFHGCPRAELAVLKVGFPVFRTALVRGLGLTPDKVARSRARVRELFAEAGRRLERSAYLAGDAFTAADLTFATHAALVLLPPQYGWKLPDVDAATARGGWPGLGDAVALRDELRATPAGRHALRVYAEERHRVV